MLWTLVLEKTLESPLDCKDIQPVHPKGNQFWKIIGRTDEAETPILWPPDAKNRLTGKDPDAGKDWRWEKGMTQDEMVGWHHWLNGCKFEQSTGDGEGQGSLVCCSPCGHKKLDTTELNWTKPVFLPGKSQGQRSLAVYHPWLATIHGVTKSRTWLSDWTTILSPVSHPEMRQGGYRRRNFCWPQSKSPLCLDGLTFLPIIVLRLSTAQYS